MIVSIEIPIPRPEDGPVVPGGCWENRLGGITTVRSRGGWGDVDAVITLCLTADQAQTLRHAPGRLRGKILADWLLETCDLWG